MSAAPRHPLNSPKGSSSAKAAGGPVSGGNVAVSRPSVTDDLERQPPDRGYSRTLPATDIHSADLIVSELLAEFGVGSLVPSPPALSDGGANAAMHGQTALGSLGSGPSPARPNRS